MLPWQYTTSGIVMQNKRLVEEGYTIAKNILTDTHMHVQTFTDLKNMAKAWIWVYLVNQVLLI